MTSYLETHYEIVSGIEQRRSTENHPKMEEINDAQGTGGFWELAQDLTDEFQEMNDYRQWDGEFFDEIENFLKLKLD